MEDPTVFEVAPSSRAQLSTDSPGRGRSLPSFASLLASARSRERDFTVSMALSISREPHTSAAWRRGGDI